MNKWMVYQLLMQFFSRALDEERVDEAEKVFECMVGVVRGV